MVTSNQSVQQHQTELIKVCKCQPRRLTSALHEHQKASLVQSDVNAGHLLLMSSVCSE